MSKKISYFRLGFFFLMGAVIIVGGLIWVKLSHFFEGGEHYVTFFDYSVGGLGPGADVHYLGLGVGRVSSVELTPDEDLVRVVMILDTNFKVKQNFAVELGFHITGSQSLSIVHAPADLEQVTPAIRFSHKYTLIPSVPGEMEKVRKRVNHISKQMESIDFKGLFAAWKKVAEDADGVITGEKVQQALTNIQMASDDLRKLLSSVGSSTSSEDLQTTLKDLAKTADSVRKSGEIIERQLKGLSPHAFSRMVDHLESVVKESESSIQAVKSRVDRSMELMQRSLLEMNQVLSEISGLAASLKESPGELFTRPKGGEPFKR